MKDLDTDDILERGSRVYEDVFDTYEVLFDAITMNFSTSTYVPIDIESEVREDQLLADFWPKRGSDVTLQWPSDEFRRLLSIAKTAAVGMRTSARPLLSIEQASEVPLWEMHLDVFCPTTIQDEKWRSEIWDSLPFVPEGRNIRRFESYRISRLKMKPRRITGPGGCFFFPRDVVELLRLNERSMGAGWGVIEDLNGSVYDEASLLVPDHLLGPVVPNDSIDRVTGEDGYEFFAPRGWALAMRSQDIRRAKSFNLTDEPTSGYNLPSVIISAGLKNFLENNGVSGVFYSPVFSSESRAYKSFIESWSALKAQVLENPKSRMG